MCHKDSRPLRKRCVSSVRPFAKRTVSGLYSAASFPLRALGGYEGTLYDKTWCVERGS